LVSVKTGSAQEPDDTDGQEATPLYEEHRTTVIERVPHSKSRYTMRTERRQVVVDVGGVESATANELMEPVHPAHSASGTGGRYASVKPDGEVMFEERPGGDIKHVQAASSDEEPEDQWLLGSGSKSMSDEATKKQQKKEKEKEQVACPATFIGEELAGTDITSLEVTGSSASELDTACCNACGGHNDCEFWMREDESEHPADGSITCWLKKSPYGVPVANPYRRGARRAFDAGPTTSKVETTSESASTSAPATSKESDSKESDSKSIADRSIVYSVILGVVLLGICGMSAVVLRRFIA